MFISGLTLYDTGKVLMINEMISSTEIFFICVQYKIFTRLMKNLSIIAKEMIKLSVKTEICKSNIRN